MKVKVSRVFIVSPLDHGDLSLLGLCFPETGLVFHFMLQSSLFPAPEELVSLHMAALYPPGVCSEGNSLEKACLPPFWVNSSNHIDFCLFPCEHVSQLANTSQEGGASVHLFSVTPVRTMPHEAQKPACLYAGCPWPCPVPGTGGYLAFHQCHLDKL